MKKPLTSLLSVLAATAFPVFISGARAQQTAAPAELHIQSDPPGARVEIDGTWRGDTPINIPGLPPGRHLLRLSKRGFRYELRTITVRPGSRGVEEIKLEPVNGLALITSTPSGANVRIGDVDRGKTSLLITDLALGQYKVHISLPGYQPRDLELKMENRAPVGLHTELVSNSATLSVNSAPSGATVTINGILKGTTPCTIRDIHEMDCTVEVALQGYQSVKQRVRLAAGTEEHIDIPLRELPATLQIVSTPANARVYVDDQPRGATPLILRKLASGSYTVRVEKDGYDPVTRTVDLERGANSVQEFRLVPNVGALRITTEPAGVHVFIDNKPSGVTAAKPDETDLISDPLDISMLAVGEHEVRLTKRGFYPFVFTIDVQRDKTVVRQARLKKMFIPNCEIKTDTDVFRGVLVKIDPAGNVKLEVRPGIVKMIPAEKIQSRRLLRMDQKEKP